MNKLLLGRLQRPTIAEAIGAVLVLALGVVLFSSVKLVRIDQMFADTAMYFQALENIATRGLPVSQISASTDTAHPFFTLPTNEILQTPGAYFGGPSHVTERSLFDGHVYLILYPLGMLARILPPPIILESLFAFVFVSMIGLVYLGLRRRAIPIFAAIVFCVLVVAHPAWSQGLLRGQFYPDRLFVLTGFALALLTSRSDGRTIVGIRNEFWIALVAVLCASANERGALIAGLFLLLYTVLYWKDAAQNRWVRLTFGFALALFGYASVHIFLPKNEAYPSFLPTTLDGLLGVVLRPEFLPSIETFLAVNLPLLLFACFEWRAALIAIVIMAPNILGNIGGAEKLGWSTHYSSYFFPVLAWAGMLGFVRLYRMADQHRVLRVSIATVCSILLTVLSSAINPYIAAPIDFSVANLINNPITQLYDELRLYAFSASTRKTLTDASRDIAAAIPPGSKVSSVESGTPLLYDGRTIQFYPDGIDQADFAVLNGHIVDGQLDYFGAITYLGQQETDLMNAAAVNRMRSDGYDLAHPLLFPGDRNMAVVRRISH